MDPYEKEKKNTKRYKKIKTLLKTIYGYDDFRPKQYEVINRIVSGEDVCAVFKTSYGKSLCFQIPALYLDRPAIIISPLISLMDDQRMILEELGISSCCYNSTAPDRSKMKKEILQGKYKFIYITPESIIHMQDFFKKLEDIQGISLIAIDEAHCISSYGFDFRKSYRELTFFKECLPQIPILAVTATATKIVAEDICKVLKLNCEEPIKTSFDRPNLYIEVREKCKYDDKGKPIKGLSQKIIQDIVPIIKEHDKQSIIIYCLTKKETEKIAEILKTCEIKCGVYHAGLENDVKAKAHHDFLNGKIKVIAATIAFGMGINKSDVRVVIHYGAPKNIEGYYQEIGRAGRDGKKSYCYAFYNFGDFKVQESLIASGNNPVYQKSQLKMLEKMRHYMTTKQCRRRLLLEHFDEEADDKCDFCDNCCNVEKKTAKPVSTNQDVKTEAKMLIELIESIHNRSFGIGMYINILRGSNNKKINAQMKKSKYYGMGKYRSLAWWEELAENLVNLGFLQKVYLRMMGGKSVPVYKNTKKGLTWTSMAELDGILGGINETQLGIIKMNNAI